MLGQGVIDGLSFRQPEGLIVATNPQSLRNIRAVRLHCGNPYSEAIQTLSNQTGNIKQRVGPSLQPDAFSEQGDTFFLRNHLNFEIGQ